MKKNSNGSSKARSLVPNKATAFNQSRVKLFLRCPKAYQFRYDYAPPGRELTPKHSSLPLKRGGWMHELQEAHWLGVAGVGKGWTDAHERLTAGFDRLFDEEKEQYGNLPSETERMFKAYLRRWKHEDSIFRVAKLPNGKPAVEFVIEVPLDKYGLSAPFKGKIDLLVEDLEYGGLWIRDAKWVRSVPGPDERMMSPQNIIYVWGMRKSGYDVRGFIYDYGRTKPPSVPTLLKRGGVSTAAKIDTDVATYYAAMVKAHGKKGAKELAKTAYREKLKQIKARESTWYVRERITVDGPRYLNGFREFIAAAKLIEKRNPKLAVRNYIYNCKWNCDYHEICVAEFQGLDISGMLKNQYTIEVERHGPEDIE